ncbi:hypothetical protein [Streptomyces sp. IB2014 016-6]|uniref:hypothetical protein n=1 Tax=Streptomyces sp. IB2014 016-6 TaxID=2517818 RepID=UPI0011CA607B|nr:hypothetical protein [Streptomyces sp. IB2014 016-6]TXL84521.1 hypothetical protein EW053_34030 [Streptomyces sp. IB2014 016-6]
MPDSFSSRPERYRTAPPELKYATLHLQSAAETLFKAHLETHSPELVWFDPKIYDAAKHQAVTSRAAA